MHNCRFILYILLGIIFTPYTINSTMKSGEPVHLAKFDFYTEYGQFYICDSQSMMGPHWTKEELDSRFLNREDFIAVLTGSYGQIKGEIQIFESEIETGKINIVEADHVVETFINISSGKLQIQACTSSEIIVELPLKTGNYRLLIYSCNLGSVVGDQGNDYYYLIMDAMPPDIVPKSEVLKMYHSK